MLASYCGRLVGVTLLRTPPVLRSSWLCFCQVQPSMMSLSPSRSMSRILTARPLKLLAPAKMSALMSMVPVPPRFLNACWGRSESMSPLS